MKQLWKIYACRDEDVHHGCVWIDYPALKRRRTIRITNETNGAYIYCEALRMDANFVHDYESRFRTTEIIAGKALVMGEWHRAKLGNLQTREDALLRIEIFPEHWGTVESWWARYRSCLDHPQTVVRISAILGMWGFALGAVGLGLSIYQIAVNPSTHQPSPVAVTTANFSWLETLVIPAIMTVVLGGWIGLVCTRLMIFFQARYRAVIDYYQALEKLNREETPHRLVFALAHAINPAMQEFAALGHTRAARQMNLVAREANREGARILGVPIRPGEYSNLPDVPPDRFAEFREAFIHRYYLGNISRITVEFSNLRPNWWALLTPNPLPRYDHTDRLADAINEDETHAGKPH